MKKGYRILFIVVTLVLGICYVNLFFIDGSMRATDYDYKLINDRFSLELNVSNSRIASKARYGIRDVSFIIEYNVSHEKMNALADAVQSDECWFQYSDGGAEIIEEYIEPYASVFDELLAMINACGHQLSYIQVYPLDADSEDRFSIAVMDITSNTIYMFYNE